MTNFTPFRKLMDYRVKLPAVVKYPDYSLLFYESLQSHHLALKVKLFLHFLLLRFNAEII